MTHKNIHDIITAEKEIQEKLDAEKKKAAEWVNQQKEEIERESRNQLEELQTANSNRQDNVKQAATEKSEEIINQAMLDVQKLKELNEEILRPIVLHHIACIDPRKTL